MVFKTVYDISNGTYNWIIPIVSVCIIILFLFITIIVHRVVKPLTLLEEKKYSERLFYNFNHPIARNLYRRLSIVFFIISLIAAGVMLYGSISYYFQFNKIINDKLYSAIEGEIHEIDYVSSNSSNVKSFKLSDRVFYTSRVNSMKLAFRNIGLLDEYLIENQYLKIFYYGKYIIRVDTPVVQ